ncbi:MAG: InlB B-repeat-containing protein, partial [Oscillospiraceae bacterium]|nr:InlB B-repeat-containing protein [Oscillospiraceae bacterium]
EYAQIAPFSSVSRWQCGDVDGDGRITINDALQVQRHIVGLSSTIDGNNANGRSALRAALICRETGSPSINDALAIQRRLVGLSTALDNCRHAPNQGSANTWVVRFNANGGTHPAARAVRRGANIGTLPTPVRDNHAFVGWFISQTGGTQVATSMAVTGNITVWARWIANATWISNSDEVHFYQNPPRVRVANVQNSADNSNIINMASSAVNVWNNVGLRSTFNNSIGASNSDIHIRFGSPSFSLNWHTQVHLGTLPDGRRAVSQGWVGHGSNDIIATPTINGRRRTIRRARNNTTSPANIFVVDTIRNRSFNGAVIINGGERGHSNTMRHELGHALGFRGHTTNAPATCIMRNEGTDNNALRTPTVVLANHVLQFRNAFNNTNPVSTSTTIQPAFDEPFAIVQDDLVLHYFSKNQIVETMIQDYGWNDNILKGIPVEILYGDNEELTMSSVNEIKFVDYLFRITDNLTRNMLPEYITVRSQHGAIFEKGIEYVISPWHVNNTLWDVHLIPHETKFIRADLLTLCDIYGLRNATVVKNSEITTNKVIAENATLTSRFVSNVDLAIVITVTDKWSEPTSPYIFDVEYTLNNIITGEEHKSLLPELLRLNSDVKIGETYLVLLDVIDGEFVLPSARDGAVIVKKSVGYVKFAKALFYNEGFSAVLGESWDYESNVVSYDYGYEIDSKPIVPSCECCLSQWGLNTALSIMRWLVGLYPNTILLHSDINQNGVIDIDDALQALRFHVGLPSALD